MIRAWRWLQRCVLPVLAWLLCASATPLHAHESLPASLLLQEVEPQVFAVQWRVPQTQGQALQITPHLPADCTPLSEPLALAVPNARQSEWQVACKGGLRTGSISFEGLSLTLIDTLVRVAYLDGSVSSHVARARTPTVQLSQAERTGLDLGGYFVLGVEHILSGFDHLLFVLCLVMLAPHWLALLKNITAFTLAHSLTLALAALGLVHVPQAPIEATIALSILFLARELARPASSDGWTRKRTWAVAFAFGLLHGFGFAGALSQVGLPAGEVPLALLLFNLGVEAGQIAFIAVAYPALALLARWPLLQRRWLTPLPVYAIGSVAGMWWLQRMGLVLGAGA